MAVSSIAANGHSAVGHNIRRRRHLALSIVSAGLLMQGCSRSESPDISTSGNADLASYVNPFVGTQAGAPDYGTGGGAGNNYPGATLPFGMVQFSPDTSPSLDNYPGGYTYTDDKIEGFSLTHISGAGCSIYQDFPFLPTLTPLDQSPAELISAGLKPAFLADFNHLQEDASPGYYRVRLNPDGAQPIDVELSATERSGMARFGFPSGTSPQVIVNVGGSQMPDALANVNIDPDRHEISGTAVSGGFCYQDDRYQVYFAAEFDRPFESYGTWTKALIQPGSTQASDVGVLITHADPIPNVPVSIPGNPSLTARAGAYVTFNAADGGLVSMRVGVSFVSIDNARANLHAENPGWDLDAMRKSARARWNRELARATVQTSDNTLRRVFYTSLYHSLLAPTLFSDSNGDYIGMDGAVHQAGAQAVYGSYSGWDIYRSQWPLLSMLDPQRVGDMTQTLVRNAQQGGWLPKWSYANQQTNVMVGDPAAILIASAHAFGARNFDSGAALDAAIKGATQPASPTQYLLTGNAGYIERAGLPEYLSLGYIPYDENVPTGLLNLVNGGLVWGTSATTLEYAVADFAVDRYATAMGQSSRTAQLRTSSGNWKNLFNPASGYIEPRLAIGTFAGSGNPATGNGFVEGSSPQYTWFVPQDMAGLITAMGGRAAAATRLDDFFTELNGGPDSSYAYLGNEPTLSTPWIYAWLGQPSKTGPLVHKAMLGLYGDAPTGLPGNDDLGTMSAWWVLAALGMNPAVPGTDLLLLSAPLMDSAQLQLPGGTLTIRRSGNGDYVQSLRLNGQQLDRAWLSFKEITNGGTLDYMMGTTASSWGVDEAQAPPSYPP